MNKKLCIRMIDSDDESFDYGSNDHHDNYYRYYINNNYYDNHIHFSFDNNINCESKEFNIDNLSILINCTNIVNLSQIEYYYTDFCYENIFNQYFESLVYNQNSIFKNNFKLIYSYNLLIKEKIEQITFLKNYNLYYNLINKNYYILFEAKYNITSYKHNLKNKITFFIPFLTNKYIYNIIIFKQFMEYKKFYKNELQHFRFHNILNIFKNTKNFQDLDIIINFDHFTNHTENDKLILYFLDLIKNSNLKYLCKEMLNNILLFLIDNVNTINEIVKDL